jgi:hypothetical protein
LPFISLRTPRSLREKIFPKIPNLTDGPVANHHSAGARLSHFRIEHHRAVPLSSRKLKRHGREYRNVK